MTTTSQAAASPFEFVLGRKTFLLSPLTDRDLGTLEQWVQDRHMELVKRNCESMTVADRHYHIDRAFEVAGNITLGSPSSKNTLSTPEGSVTMLWLSLLHKHPEMKKEDVSALCENVKELEEACKKVLDRSKPTAPKKKGGSKAQVKKKTRKKRR